MAAAASSIPLSATRASELNVGSRPRLSTAAPRATTASASPAAAATAVASLLPHSLNGPRPRHHCWLARAAAAFSGPPLFPAKEPEPARATSPADADADAVAAAAATATAATVSAAAALRGAVAAAGAAPSDSDKPPPPATPPQLTNSAASASAAGPVAAASTTTAGSFTAGPATAAAAGRGGVAATAAATTVPSAGPFSVFGLPGMDPAGPPGYQASGEELLAAVAAAAPDQKAVWYAVAELMPLLLHATAGGPLRGFALDLETTGKGWRLDRILEVAVVDVATGEAFTSMINPNGRGQAFPLSAETTKLTGITSDHLLFAPSDPWVSLALLAWLYQRCRAAGGARPAIIGHNARGFDSYVMAKVLAFHGCLLPPSWCVVDTLTLARRWRPAAEGGNKLGALRQHYGLPEPEAEHRALPDAWLSVEVLAAMLTQERGYGGGGSGGGGGSSARALTRDQAGVLVHQALNDGGLLWPSTASPDPEIHQLVDEDKAMQLLQHIALSVAKSVAGKQGGGSGGVSNRLEVLLSKTGNARRKAATLQPHHHGPDWSSRVLPSSRQHPSHPEYDLPTSQELLSTATGSAAGGPAAAAAKKKKRESPDQSTMLGPRSASGGRAGAPASSPPATTAAAAPSQPPSRPPSAALGQATQPTAPPLPPSSRQVPSDTAGPPPGLHSALVTACVGPPLPPSPPPPPPPPGPPTPAAATQAEAVAVTHAAAATAALASQGVAAAEPPPPVPPPGPGKPALRERWFPSSPPSSAPSPSAAPAPAIAHALQPQSGAGAVVKGSELGHGAAAAAPEVAAAAEAAFATEAAAAAAEAAVAEAAAAGPAVTAVRDGDAPGTAAAAGARDPPSAAVADAGGGTGGESDADGTAAGGSPGGPGKPALRERWLPSPSRSPGPLLPPRPPPPQPGMSARPPASASAASSPSVSALSVSFSFAGPAVGRRNYVTPLAATGQQPVGAAAAAQAEPAAKAATKGRRKAADTAAAPAAATGQEAAAGLGLDLPLTRRSRKKAVTASSEPAAAEAEAAPSAASAASSADSPAATGSACRSAGGGEPAVAAPGDSAEHSPAAGSAPAAPTAKRSARKAAASTAPPPPSSPATPSPPSSHPAAVPAAPPPPPPPSVLAPSPTADPPKARASRKKAATATAAAVEPIEPAAAAATDPSAPKPGTSTPAAEPAVPTTAKRRSRAAATTSPSPSFSSPAPPYASPAPLPLPPPPPTTPPPPPPAPPRPRPAVPTVPSHWPALGAPFTAQPYADEPAPPPPQQRPRARPPAQPTVPSHWPALGAPFGSEPHLSELWDRVLRPASLRKALGQAAARGSPLATPFGALLYVPRALTLHGEGLDAGRLQAMALAKDEMRQACGSLRALREAMKEVREWTPAGDPEGAEPVPLALPVVLRATFRDRDFKLTRLMPRGWMLSGRVRLEEGELHGGVEMMGLYGLEIQASWADWSNPRADKPLGALRSKLSQPGSSWVLRGTLKPMAADGCRFELASPDVLAPDCYDPDRDRVTATYRASTPLDPAEVRTLAGRLLDELAGGAVALPDPLPPAARDELVAHLTANAAAGGAAGCGAAGGGPGGAGASTGASSSSASAAAAAPTPVPVSDVPSLREAFEILHRPRVEHFQPCAFRRPGGGSGGPTDLTPLRAAGMVVAFHELFFSQLRMQQLRRSVRGPNWAPVSGDDAVSAGLSCLGFSLTGAQRVAVGEVLGDMRPERASTMYRLLQGDVGSGKTAVALLALLAAASCGLQGVLVAPTGVLAQQHGAALAALLARMGEEGRRRWGLPEEPLVLLGEATARERRSAHCGLADGSIRLAVGTHALLNVPEFARLGLLVLDESHKFGVAQMEALSTLIARRPPHLLNMTATPIPRTLAAAMYGHMDVSRLDELPPGRTPVRTTLVQDDSEVPYEDPGQEREVDAMWREVMREVTTGDPPGRAFVVYPLREASTAAAAADGADSGDSDGGDGGGRAPSAAAARAAALADLKNAEDQAKLLAGVFEPAGVPTRLLTGKMKAAEKQEALEAFRSGSVRLLVCTTVVEVGLDVPEATVVVVEHAERFGLAQLHQLRGRVGRGGRPGRCFLVVPWGDAAARERLGIMETTTDGFRVAEWDLERRGVGHLFGSGSGTRQHGRMDVSHLTQAVLGQRRGPAGQQGQLDSRGAVALIEAARRAAAAVAREWEAEGEGGADRAVTEQAMEVFRPQSMSASDALAV